jgi:hypothetical protein
MLNNAEHTLHKVYWDMDGLSDPEEMTRRDLADLQSQYSPEALSVKIQGVVKGKPTVVLGVSKAPTNVVTPAMEGREELIAHMTDQEKAFDILQIIGQFVDDDMDAVAAAGNSREFKLLAVELAETLGPDHCQTLYRLAVLATKLA